MGALGGSELEDKEILFPAVTVGPPGGNASLPAKDKFKLEDNCFIFPNFPVDNHELVIPGEEGLAGATLLFPAKLLMSIFSGLCEAMQAKVGSEEDEEGNLPSLTWAAVFGEDFGACDDED